MSMGLFFLAFKTGEFFQDIALPAIAGGLVILFIINSVLSKWGFRLW